MLKDKEVGELWRTWKVLPDDKLVVDARNVVIKLVVERAHLLACGGDPDSHDYEVACRQFSINPKEFNAASKRQD